MKRKFVTNLGFLLFLNLLVKPFWIFGIDRTVQNIVAPGEYGFYFSILNFTFLFNILLDLGITNFNNRNIAQHSQLLNKHFSAIVLIRLLLGLLYLLVLFVVGIAIGYDGRHLYFLLFLGINQFLAASVLYLRSNISGLLMFKTDSVLSVLDRLIMIGVCGMLIWGHISQQPFRIMWFVYAQTLAYMITALVALAIVIKKSNFKRVNWDVRFFMVILKKSLPFALLFLLMSLYSRVDSVMLDRMLPGREGVMQVDVYAKAFRWLDAVNMIAYLFSVLLIPIFSHQIKHKQPVQEIMRLSFTMLLTASLVFSVTSVFFSHQIMALLYHRQVEEATRVFEILILGFIPMSATYVFGTLLTANGNLKELNIMAVLAVLLNTLLNLILIPGLLAYGSAIASLTTQLLTAIVQMVLAFYFFKPGFPRWFALRIISFVGCLLLMGYAVRMLPVQWPLQAGAMLVVAAMLIFVFRFFALGDIKQLLREGR